MQKCGYYPGPGYFADFADFADFATKKQQIKISLSPKKALSDAL